MKVVRLASGSGNDTRDDLAPAYMHHDFSLWHFNSWFVALHEQIMLVHQLKECIALVVMYISNHKEKVPGF